MRPNIICHMISSIDGRLLPERWSAPADETERDIIGETYERIAAQLPNDGFIIGRKTMEMFDGISSAAPSHGTGEPGARQCHIARNPLGKVAIVIDPQGKLRYAVDSIDGGHHVITVLAESVSDEYLQSLREAGVSYLFAGKAGDRLDEAMETLHRDFGLRSLLLEGGGVINGGFLEAGLIDEISLLIYPGIDGLAGVPSIFEYLGEENAFPAKGQVLRLTDSSAVGDGIVWLRYDVERRQ